MPGATAKILLWTYFKNCVFLCIFIPCLYFSTEGHLHLGSLKNKCERLHPSCLVLAWFLSGAETRVGDNHTRVYSANTCVRKRAGSWRRLWSVQARPRVKERGGEVGCRRSRLSREGLLRPLRSCPSQESHVSQEPACHAQLKAGSMTLGSMLSVS